MKKITAVTIIGLFILFMVSSFDDSPLNNQRENNQSYEDSLEADRTAYVKQIREAIKGKESMRADSVFKNIKTLKVPAGRLLAMMNMGFSRSLGVSCGHCHNTSDFSSEEKVQKEVARQMFVMTNKINTELLASINGLSAGAKGINCTTCHRGEVKPALNLPTK